MEHLRLATELQGLVFPGSELPDGFEKLRTAGSNGTGMPWFFMCRRDRDIWIVVRGASEPADFILAADFEKVNFPIANPRNVTPGKAHQGVLSGARWILEKCQREVDQADNIFCTGHSLGGATSAMIAAILYLEQNKNNVHAFCCAPFPILTRPLCNLLANHVTSFAFRSDVVPRLTQTNIANLVRMFGGPQAAPMIQGMVSMMMNQVASMQAPMGWTTPMTDITARVPGIVQKLFSLSPSDPETFWLPGKAFYLWNDETGFGMVRLFADSDMMMQINLGGLGDHDGTLYNDAIMCLDTLDL